MATIQIRDVPDDAYETFRRRARAEGKSLQAYMRDEVVRLARLQSKREVMDELDAALARSGGSGVTVEDVLADLDAERR